MVSLQLEDLLKETLDVECGEGWENEHISNTVTGVGVRLHAMGLSLREIVVVFEWLGVDRSLEAIWNWMHKLADSQPDLPTLQPLRVAVDREKKVAVRGDRH